MNVTLTVGYKRYIQPQYGKRTAEEKQSQNIDIAEEAEVENSGTSEIFSFALQNGQSFSVSKSEEYTADNPLWTVKKSDSEGKITEEEIDPRIIDPKNASFVEFSVLSIWLGQTGEYDMFDVNFQECMTENILEKSDYLGAVRDWRDEQSTIGNMIGYNNAVKVCSAISNFVIDQSGESDYVETADGVKKAYLVDAGDDNFVLGSGISGTGKNAGYYYAVYAPDSTLENPIVEVHSSEEKVYRIYVNEVDPENATQMEMFALCAHADRQNIHNTTTSSYEIGFEHELFRSDTPEEFTTQKKDWMSKIKELEDNVFGSSSWQDELKQMLEKFTGKNIASKKEDKEKEISEEAIQRLFEERN